MSDDLMREVYRTFQTSQDKLVYFELAVAMTAIGFSITQTSTLALSYSLIPLGISVLCWGISFISGILNRMYINSVLYANYDFLKLQAGLLPDAKYGNHPDYIKAASEGIKLGVEINAKRINRYSQLQTWLLYLGVVFYLIWHIYEMYLRT